MAAARIAAAALCAWSVTAQGQVLQLRPSPMLPAVPPTPEGTVEAFSPGGPLRLRPSYECPECAKASERLSQPAATEALVTVLINLEPKGERAVLVGADGDVLVREPDLRVLGLGAFVGETTTVGGQPYMSLRAARGLTFRLNEATLELDLRVPISALGRRNVLDFATGTGVRPPPRGAGGAFLNYNFTGNGDDRAGLQDYGVAGEVGTHLLGGLFTTDFLANRDVARSTTRAVRLSSTLVYDDVERLQRWTLGDNVAASGQLGGSLRFAGLSFSRRFALDPYFVRFPGQIVTGTAALPSEVFVYSNGLLVRRERVSPGTFELTNLTNLSGLQVTEVVVRDVLGNEQRIVNPFYFTDTLLRAGLDEYSVDVGLERRNFGTSSGDYGSPGFSGFYRRGLTDHLTLGIRGEGLRDVLNAGPSATVRLGTVGVLGASVGLSHGPNGSGSAWAASHAYTAGRFGTSVAYRHEDFAYARVGSAFSTTRSEVSATANWAPAGNSTFGVGLRDTALWSGASGRQWSATYTQRLARDLSASVVGQKNNGTLSSTEVFLTMSYQFGIAGQPANVTAQHQKLAHGSSDTLQLAGGAYEAPGLTYRMQVRTDETNSTRSQTINPALQYNFDRVTTRAEYFRNTADPSGRYQLAAAGAIASVGGQWGLSRPIFDSYGIAKVDNLPGVRVYANYQEVGRTGADGTVFIPRLASYFSNPVTLEPKDLPIDYTVPQIRRTVVPALRSGVLIDFEARRVQAVKGRLVERREAGESRPFHGAVGSLRAGERDLEVYTAQDGTFYVEDLGTGTFNGSAQSSAGTCAFRLAVPETKEVVLDLGEVVCNAR